MARWLIILVSLSALGGAAGATDPPPSPPTVAGSDLAGYDLMVGEGWGCVLVTSDRKSAWECWEAPPDGTGASLSAWRVPWLAGRRVVGGPDRLCTVESEEVRCFHPPRRGETAPRPSGVVPPAGDAGTTSPPTHGHLDPSSLYEGLVGGTFA